ncbi:EF-hand domain-containing protein [Kaarinaea lacus]
MIKISLTLGITVVSLVLVSCAAKRSHEIGDPSVASPETQQHYQTIYDAFSRHDTNNDGFLDEHEFAQLQTDPNVVRMRQRISELADSGPLMFSEVDEDGDGRISENEITVIIQPLLPKKQ